MRGMGCAKKGGGHAGKGYASGGMVTKVSGYTRSPKIPDAPTATKAPAKKGTGGAAKKGF